MDICINKKMGIEECMMIMKTLQDYFDENGIELFGKDILEDELITIKEEKQICGFITLKRKFEQTYEISWLAVEKEFQGKGIGTRLIEESIKYLKEKNVKLLMVKTLAETVDYKPYEKTRAFYEKNGFLPLDIIKDYSEWEQGNDCKIYVKVI